MKIRAFASAFPQNRYSAKEISEWTGADAEFIRNKLGISSRAFLGPNETGQSLAKSAVNTLSLENPELDMQAIEAVVLITQTPDHRLPHMSAELHAALELPTTCAAFDVGLGCSGYVYGLSIIRGFMALECFSNALLVTCDPYSKIMARDDRDTVSVFGDAASATWINSAQGGKVGRTEFGTDGSDGMNLCVKSGGGAEPSGGIWADASTAEQADCRLYMNGRAIFNFMVKTAPASIDACLAANELTRDDIDYFIVHQASGFMVKTLTKHLKISPEKVPCDLEETGNTVSSSIPIMLEKLTRQGELRNRRVLLCGFGVGLSWASTIVSFGE